MNKTYAIARTAAVVCLGICLILPMTPARAAESSPPLPAVIQAGFAYVAKGQPELAVDLWRKGGLMQGEYRSPANATYFKEAEAAIGAYRAYEVVATKWIGQNSQYIYLAINYERGAVYARFLLYHTAKDWVVQSMEFNTKPETIMPWLALE